MPKKTDGEIHHQWTMLVLAADRAEEEMETTWKKGNVGLRRFTVIRDHAIQRRKIADQYEDRYFTRIQKHIKACKGEEN